MYSQGVWRLSSRVGRFFATGPGMGQVPSPAGRLMNHRDERYDGMFTYKIYEGGKRFERFIVVEITKDDYS